jgi:hypothetical protein
MRFFAIALIVAGCAHSGPRFELRQAQDKDAAVVYLYRVSQFTASALHPDVILDGAPWGTIDNGGYARLELAPGRHKLEVKARKDLNHGVAWLELESGREYFLKYIIDHGFSWGANIAESAPLAIGIAGGAVGGAVAGAVYGAASSDPANPAGEPLLYVESPDRDAALQELAETTLIEHEERH